MCRTDRIKQPKDLKGTIVVACEYQLTANVWARAILEDDFGVKRRTCAGARRHRARRGPRKITVTCRPAFVLENAPGA